MRDLDPVHPSELVDSAVDPTTGRQEVIELLGDSVVTAVEGYSEHLTYIDGIANTENPFTASRPSEVDLTFLKPEQAARIEAYPDNRWSRTDLRDMSRLTRVRLGYKLGSSSTKIHNIVENKIGSTGLDLQINGINMDKAFKDYPDGGTSLDFTKVQFFIDSLDFIAGRLPAKATMAVLDNIYCATADLYRYRREAFRRTSGQPTLKGPKIAAEIVAEADQLRSDLTKLDSIAKTIRSRGAKQHESLMQTVKTEQGMVALQLLDFIGSAKDVLPRREGLTDAQLEKVKDADSYLGSQVDTVEAALASADPGFLTNPNLQAEIKRLRAPVLATTTKEQPQPIQEGTRVLSSQVSEARDVLRGGRRLKPQKGQTVQEIQQKADSLHSLRTDSGDSLLEPEESGVIMACVTGKFGSFATIIERVSQGGDDGQLTTVEQARPEAIKILRDFNLLEASIKIKDLMEDEVAYPKLIEVLTGDETSSVQITVSKFIESATAA
jgi:hypothetical protein